MSRFYTAVDEAESDCESIGYRIEKASTLLNEAYDMVSGSSEALGMIYERLQNEGRVESAKLSNVVNLLRRSLDASFSKIGVADEILAEIGKMAREE